MRRSRPNPVETASSTSAGPADPAGEDHPPSPEPPFASVRQRPRGLVTAILVGALVAGAGAYFAIPRGERAAPIHIPRRDLSPPSRLADVAGGTTPSLRPIVIRGGKPVLGTGPAYLAGAARPGTPARLSIPALGLDVPVDAVQGTANGIEVPPVGRAGWFDGGPRPGEPGRAVVIGHIDAANGPGIFALLPGVANGTVVNVTDSRGAVHRFRIVGKAEIQKSKFPTEAVYGPSPRPVLILITCGGPYQPGVGYRDNVLVYASAA